MEEQDKRIEEQTNGDAPASTQPRTAETQVGQVIQSISRATRQLTTPAPAPSKRAVAQAANTAMRERIANLIVALGDPQNPLHHQAVDELVSIGAPAVPALNEALSPTRPWLTAYRAAEALGQIGDGRAAGPLLEALRHPNSNVRWSAVRALAVVGDARALLELRRVAREDQSKTSWGESVGGTAQSVLDQMQSHNMLLRGADLIKTAISCVLMLVALILAWSVVNTLRAELRQVGHERMPANIASPLEPTTRPSSDDEESTSRAPTPVPTPVSLFEPTTVISGSALFTGNVRALPSTSGERIGGISEGDEVIFIAASPDRNWYLIRLGERHASSSQINSSDGTGWASRSLLSEPEGELPTETISTVPIQPTEEPTSTYEAATQPTSEPTTNDDTAVQSTDEPNNSGESEGEAEPDSSDES